MASVYFQMFMRILIYPAILCCLVSCGGYQPYYVPVDRQRENTYYHPVSANALAVSKKNDISLNLWGGVETTEVQAAVMVSDNFALSASYMFDERYPSTDANVNPKPSSQHFGSLSTGYIKQLHGNIQFETYAGIGLGKLHNRHFTGTSDTRITQFYLQPAIGLFNENRTMMAGFVSKFAFTSLKLEDFSIIPDRESYSMAQLNSIRDKPSHFFWEPGILLKAGWKIFMFSGTFTYSVDLSGNKIERTKYIFGTGFTVRLNASKKMTATEISR
jgi:hypothetical protein